MKITTLIALATASIVHGHLDPLEDYGMLPQIVGGRKLFSQLKARGALPTEFQDSAVHYKERDLGHGDSQLGTREDADSTCGAGIGSCGAGQCCSLAGYCGVGSEYCTSPDCQFKYGPGCDANTVPAGTTTANITRPKLGSVEYGGVGIYDCLVPGDVAFTFDDGPYLYTQDLLDKFKKYNAKATFFITGNNIGKGPIDSTPAWSAAIKRMIAEDHQVASHTWSHQNLSSLDAATFSNQMLYNEMAFRNILGFFPTYMRPPYSDCNAVCQSRLSALGYHITYFDIDTAGYLNDDVNQIQNSKNIWDATIGPANPSVDSFLEIEHDIHYQTVYNLTDYILSSIYSRGFKSVTVGECLGDPVANWYRAASGVLPTTSSAASTAKSTGTASVPPAQSTGPIVSLDGTCSATTTCTGSTFGGCCSKNGYCGSTSDYCGAGCQPGSGTCGITLPAGSTTPIISTDGTCSANVTCIGSEFGNCCSVNGYCGSTIDYCDVGCQPAFGSCGTLQLKFPPNLPSTAAALPPKATLILTTLATKPATPTSTSKINTAVAIPTPTTVKPSPIGSCVGTTGYTGKGNIYGICSSAAGRCGSFTLSFSQPYCGAGYQSKYSLLCF